MTNEDTYAFPETHQFLYDLPSGITLDPSAKFLGGIFSRIIVDRDIIQVDLPDVKHYEANREIVETVYLFVFLPWRVKAKRYFQDYEDDDCEYEIGDVQQGIYIQYFRAKEWSKIENDEKRVRYNGYKERNDFIYGRKAKVNDDDDEDRVKVDDDGKVQADERKNDFKITEISLPLWTLEEDRTANEYDLKDITKTSENGFIVYPKIENDATMFPYTASTLLPKHYHELSKHPTFQLYLKNAELFYAKDEAQRLEVVEEKRKANELIWKQSWTKYDEDRKREQESEKCLKEMRIQEIVDKARKRKREGDDVK